MQPLRRVLLALAAVAAVALGLPPSPAAAHGTLGMSIPAQGATVSSPLGSVELFFTEQVPANAYFAITAPGGGRVDNGWEHAAPRPLDKPVTEYFMVNGKFEPRQYTTGYPARVRVAHLPEAGEYRVEYLSRASDGDSVRGSVTFKYTGPATAAPVGWVPPANQADPALTAGHEGAPASAPAAGAPPASAAAPPAAARQEEDGRGGLLAWLGGGTAAVAAVAGLLLWRRRHTLSTARPSPRGATRDRPRAAARAKGRDRPKRPGGAVSPAAPADPQPATADRRSISLGPLAVGAVVVALIGGYALGRTTATSERPTPSAQAAAAVATGHQHGGGAATLDATGTTVSAGGYTFQPVHRSQPRGTKAAYSFRIVGPDRQPATRYAVVHDKPLHLVVTGRDLTGFQHLHPTMSPDGLWSVPLTLPKAGTYRVFADFTVETPAGATVPLVLGADHHVAGDAPHAELPSPAGTAQAGPFTVTMQGAPRAGATVPVLFRVTRSGTPATLEPYLGSYGHLVILREGDLGYVHVHPDPALADGAVKVAVSIPAAARYRAFLEFQVAGEVHRAEFTLDLT
ncbi:copper resistance CopC family protein [Paractinoplanes deccanensis]|uniref:copper resistance CopC family protein n=1 Tax=Paractinoplanes deccanensis TaxID=113561 RepID=UPI003606C03B